jgi:DNA modification methylase
MEQFLDGRVILHGGDSREVLKTIADCSIDSVVTDPPYSLVSIVKRFGNPNAAPAKGNDAYMRASAGFMGKTWDTGETAFDLGFWAECLRVLKPGGHVVAFSGTRTCHRMACAIEDAGFEVRDTISWLYGSGFPKSHDVSKGIDRRKNWSALPELQNAIRSTRQGLGISQSEAARRMELIGPDEDLGGGGFMWFETGMRAPTREQWPKLKAALSIGDEFDACFEQAEREVIDQGYRIRLPGTVNNVGFSYGEYDITAPATDAARQWDGWGTALKPACELIVLARKPLSEGTVAANVLRWGCGAINVDGCRIHNEGSEAKAYTVKRLKPGATLVREGGNWRPDDENAAEYQGMTKDGRWPANVIHDGSDEVVAGFPETDSGGGPSAGDRNGLIYGEFAERSLTNPDRNTGSAARFFYTAKADSDDRLGSKHPTVKPLDLMQYLVRLVTPPKGVVLDPFAGTGTTGEAAFREGFDAVLIEREEEYQADIRRRMALVMAGPDERIRESIKARNLPRDDGPLFALEYGEALP